MVLGVLEYGWDSSGLESRYTKVGTGVEFLMMGGVQRGVPRLSSCVAPEKDCMSCTFAVHMSSKWIRLPALNHGVRGEDLAMQSWSEG